MDRPLSFDRLFHPRSVALVGASETPGRIGRIVLDFLEASPAQLFLVNPKHRLIKDRPVFASPEELPDEVDLVVLAVNAEAAVEAAEICARKKAAFIVVIAGGFGETGEEGRALEARLKALPATFGSRILGPNSLGVFVPESRLDTIFVEHGDKALAGGGGIAFITQSGSVGVESLGLASNMGFGLRAFVGIGNKADLNESHFLPWFGEDGKTDCLALYVESIEGGRDFLEQAREVALEKPVVLLKAGRTVAGASAVSSHTGRLAGSDKVVGGALRQYGLQRAMDDEELCDAARVLSTVKCLPRGNRVAVVSSAGGFGVMCTDYIDSPDPRAALAMAELSPDTERRIREKNLPFASCHNPVDLTAGGSDRMYLDTIEALLDDGGVDLIILVALFSPPAVTQDLIPAMGELIRRAEKPVLVLSQFGPYTDDLLKRFHREGAVGFPSIFRVVRAARFLVERARIVKGLEEENRG